MKGDPGELTKGAPQINKSWKLFNIAVIIPFSKHIDYSLTVGIGIDAI